MSADLTLLAAALAWDTFFGEPPSRVHPVVWMGKLIGALERPLRTATRTVQLVGGAVIAVVVPVICVVAGSLLLHLFGVVPVLGLLCAIALTKSTFALRALGDAARRVRAPLRDGDLPAAREGLRHLCSRDPSNLDGPALAGGTVSSIAENASDSFVAPLFYFALFGLPGALVYRAVNTMDAMIGYHGRFEFLGKAAARLDDMLNYVPARLTALLLLAAGALLGEDVARGCAVWQRDARKTESPNGGHPMAAMAGLLGVRLVKPDHYELGDDVRPLGAETIDRAWRVVRLAALLAAVIASVAMLLQGRHDF
jgi:adenosylcobinamide-phosphate synthase